MFANGFENLTKGRMDHTPDQQKTQQENRQHEQVHVEVVFHVEQTEQLAAWHRLNAVFTACERGLQAKEEHHLCQGQGDHRKVNALTTDGQETHHQGQNGRSGRAQEHTPLRIETPCLGRISRHVTCRAHEHGMPK